MFIFLCIYILFPIITTIFMECFPPKTISGILFFVFLSYSQFLVSVYHYYIFLDSYKVGNFQMEILYRLGAFSFMFLLSDILIALSLSKSFILLPVFLLNVSNIAVIIYFNILEETYIENESVPLFYTNNTNLKEGDSYPDAEIRTNNPIKNTYQTIHVV